MKSLAVIILNWNGASLLKRYLPAVISNTAQRVADIRVEIIVADNASTDESLDIMKSDFPEVTVITLDKNYGFTGGYNRAIAAVNHDYVLLLNSDVAPSEGWLEPLVSLMENDPTIAISAPKILDDKDHSLFEYAGAAGGLLDIFGYPFCRGRVMNRIEADHGQYDDNADCLWVSGAALLIRRALYIDNGGLDEDFFAHMEEIDLCWRLKNMGHRVVACGESSVFHLGGATLSSANPHKTYLNFRNNLIMMTKNYNTWWWGFVIFGRLLLDGAAGAMYIMQGKPRFVTAIVKAHWHYFGTLGSSLRKRRELSNKRSKSLPKEIFRGIFYFAK